MMTEDDDSTAAPNNGTDEPDDMASESERLRSLYDLDGDGKVSIVESLRATLGVVDARMQSLAERDGLLGKLAAVAHRVLDRFDNDGDTSKPVE